jgi:hypothetical protein
MYSIRLSVTAGEVFQENLTGLVTTAWHVFEENLMELVITAL